MAGIYLHIPFCNSKCIYCGFYSVVGREIREKFVPALRREISLRRNFFDTLPKEQQTIKTLYIGGGTPSVLPIATLSEIVALLRDNFSFPDGAFEFTIEVNPDDVTKEYAAGLKRLGVNRVSMGIQSFEDTHLRWMARRHNAEEAVEAFAILREAGFDNISADLIFGFPLLSMAQWEGNLKKLTALSPEHISAYQLSIDENTPLERLASKGHFIPADEAACSLQYSMLQSLLKEAGYEQYEISNFARPGFESRHNLKYWLGDEYIGFGPAAASDFAGKRYTNRADIHNYIRGMLEQDVPILSECETIPARERAGEYVMLRLRTNRGISPEEYEKNYLMPFSPLLDVIRPLAEQGCFLLERKRWKLTPEGYLISNQIIARLQEAQEASDPLAKKR